VNSLGSQRRRKSPYSGSGGRGGKGGGGGGDGAEHNKEKDQEERKKIYQKVRRRANNALKENNFSYAASIATSVVISRTSVSDLTTLFLAGAKAFQEGKSQEWKPEPSELASSGIKHAQEKTGLTLSRARSRQFNQILTANLQEVSKKRGKYP